MPYCENCGNQVTATAKFCGNCGTPRTPTITQESTQPAAQAKPVEAAKPAPTTQAKTRTRLEYYSPPNMACIPSAPYPLIGQQPQPQIQYQAPVMQPAAPIQPQPQAIPAPQPFQSPTGENNIGVILFRRMKSLGRYDSFAGVITTQRMIFAVLTADMLNQAAQQAREQAKAEGKGFFGQWGDQLRGTMGYINKYRTMPPDAILAETPGNFAIYNSTISEVKIHLKGQGDDDGPREFEAEIKTSAGTYKYRMNEDRDITDLLKRVYGDRVKMPFGYLGSVNIKV